MTPSIRVQPHLSHNQFGCSETIFKQHIQGKDLEVLGYENKFYSVLVDGDVYTIHESDTDKAYHAAALEYNEHDIALVDALKK